MRRWLLGWSCCIVLLAVATPVRAQSITSADGPHLRLDIDRLLAQEPHARAFGHDVNAGVEPLIPLPPLLDRLPRQLIPQLLRTEDRLTFHFDNYRVRPRIGLHEVSIVITPKLP